MNCKPGDLALVVCADSPAAGMMLTVIERGQLPGARPSVTALDGPLWRVDRELWWHNPVTGEVATMPLCPDCILMPIRPEADPESVLTEQEIAR